MSFAFKINLGLAILGVSLAGIPVVAQGMGNQAPAGPLNGIQQQLSALESRVASLEAQLASGPLTASGGGLILSYGWIGPGAVRYSINPLGTSGATANAPIPADGALTALAVNPVSNTLAGGTGRVVVVLNGQETALSVTIGTNSMDVLVLPANVPVSAGDRITVKFDGTGVTGGDVWAYTTVLYAAR